jgi:hypothetical protein
VILLKLHFGASTRSQCLVILAIIPNMHLKIKSKCPPLHHCHLQWLYWKKVPRLRRVRFLGHQYKVGLYMQKHWIKIWIRMTIKIQNWIKWLIVHLWIEWTKKIYRRRIVEFCMRVRATPLVFNDGSESWPTAQYQSNPFLEYYFHSSVTSVTVRDENS